MLDHSLVRVEAILLLCFRMLIWHCFEVQIKLVILFFLLVILVLKPVTETTRGTSWTPRTTWAAIPSIGFVRSYCGSQNKSDH